MLIAARDPERLSRAMLALARDERQRRRLAANGRALVVARFTVDRMIDDYAQAYAAAYATRAAR